MSKPLAPVRVLVVDDDRAICDYMETFLMKDGFEASATACGVTPQAQNTGTSRGPNSGASPQSGLLMSAIPSADGSASIAA